MPELDKPVDVAARKILAERIGSAIADARRKAGLSSEAFAERIGISRNSLSSWENGRGLPDVYSLARLSQRLELSFDELILGGELASEIWYDKFSSHSNDYRKPTAIPDYGRPDVTLPDPAAVAEMESRLPPGPVADVLHLILQRQDVIDSRLHAIEDAESAPQTGAAASTERHRQAK